VGEVKNELGLKYVGPVILGLSRVYDRILELAIKDAKEILLVLRGENKANLFNIDSEYKVHSQKKKKSAPEISDKQNIEEIVACIDLLGGNNENLSQNNENIGEEAYLRAALTQSNFQ